MAKPIDPPKQWDRWSIHAELMRQGISIADLAQQAKISTKAFSHVWTRVTRKAESVIANCLETPASELWPDRYPIKTSYRVNTKRAQVCASQKYSQLPDAELVA